MVLLFSYRKDKENKTNKETVWRLGRLEDLYWGVSASRDLGGELQLIRADISVVTSYPLGRLLKKLKEW